MDQGQLRPDTERGQKIINIIRKYKPQNIVEIGTWKGLGSTLCILQAIDNYNANFISLESNKEFYDIACNNLKDYLNKVKLIYGKIVDISDIKKFVLEKEIPDNELEWLKEDIQNFKKCADVTYYIPEIIDFLLLDGGEFSTYCEWQKLKSRTKIVAMDDIRRLKCSDIIKELSNDPKYDLIEGSSEGEGFAVFKLRE